MSEQIWREPREESVDLYPGLVVHDGRVTGSITFGRTRLPIWAVIGEALYNGWEDVERGYAPVQFTQDQFVSFLYHLVEMRGEFARLLLVLANAERDGIERDERSRRGAKPWWDYPPQRKIVADQLRRCLATLGEDA